MQMAEYRFRPPKTREEEETCAASTKLGPDRGPYRGPDHGPDNGSDYGPDQGKNFKIQNSKFKIENSKLILLRKLYESNYCVMQNVLFNPGVIFLYSFNL